jgi:hypothetical protein
MFLLHAASQPFSWLRACGLRCVAEALSSGLQDGQALAAVLETTYSQGGCGDAAACNEHESWPKAARCLLLNILKRCTCPHSITVISILN